MDKVTAIADGDGCHELAGVVGEVLLAVATAQGPQMGDDAGGDLAPVEGGGALPSNLPEAVR